MEQEEFWIVPSDMSMTERLLAPASGVQKVLIPGATSLKHLKMVISDFTRQDTLLQIITVMRVVRESVAH
jgi:hypothetical protein